MSDSSSGSSVNIVFHEHLLELCSTSIYSYVQVHACVCVPAQAHVFLFMYGEAIKQSWMMFLRHYPPYLFIIFLLFLSLAWSASIPASPGNLPVCLLLHWNYKQVSPRSPDFPYELKCSCLCVKHFTEGVISPAFTVLS